MSTQPTEQIYLYDADKRFNWRHRLRELLHYRYLLRNLVIRNVKVRYKNSVLGILWSLLNPLGLMLVFTIIFSILSGDNAPRQYPIFILVGIIPWNFFAGSIMGGSVSILENSALLKKVYFPRELLPTATLLSELVNFLFGFIVLVVFLYAFGLGLTWNALWLPLILLTQLIFTLGLTLLLSAATVFYRDVLMILDVVLQAWFFLSPIIYSFETLFASQTTVMGITFDPAQVMRWMNPMASIIDGYRTVLWGTASSTGPGSMNPVFLLRTLVQSTIILIISYIIFLRTEHAFGERL